MPCEFVYCRRIKTPANQICRLVESSLTEKRHENRRTAGIMSVDKREKVTLGIRERGALKALTFTMRSTILTDH